MLARSRPDAFETAAGFGPEMLAILARERRPLAGYVWRPAKPILQPFSPAPNGAEQAGETECSASRRTLPAGRVGSPITGLVPARAKFGLSSDLRQRSFSFAV